MPSKSPDAFRTISEVADWLNTPAHVLRFWESKFSQVKPVKRAGGRRYYRPADMTLLGGIKKLLHDDGMTIKGVQKILREQGIKHVSAMSPPLEEDLEAMIEATPQATPAPMAPETGQVLDFTSRSGPGDAPPDTPAPSEPESAVPLSAPNETLREATPEITDLFAPEGTGSDNAFASPEKATPAPSAPDSPAETADTEGLPDFLQKPMSERLAETPGGPSATPLPEEALDNPPPADPAETTKAAEDAPQAPRSRSQTRCLMPCPTRRRKPRHRSRHRRRPKTTPRCWPPSCATPRPRRRTTTMMHRASATSMSRPIRATTRLPPPRAC
ncbi:MULTISPECIES: MerR family transcriptional regulator [unclassified Marinovum]|uniref:MerR family transcriptional regulator n=1 Tax=unclassified Marinovum TaxID=2647166 RepID=UPI003EDBA73E